MPELMLSLFLFALIYGGLVNEHRARKKRGINIHVNIEPIHAFITATHTAIAAMVRFKVAALAMDRLNNPEPPEVRDTLSVRVNTDPEQDSLRERIMNEISSKLKEAGHNVYEI